MTQKGLLGSITLWIMSRSTCSGWIVTLLRRTFIKAQNLKHMLVSDSIRLRWRHALITWISCKGRLLRSEYYQHLTYFPHDQTMDITFFDEMKGLLIWGLTGKQIHSESIDGWNIKRNSTDSLTSLDSLTPYDEATMDRFLRLIKNMQGLLASFYYCLSHPILP